MRPAKKRQATPDDILRLAARNPLIQAIMNEWRCGSVGWEEALTWMVAALAEQNDRLTAGLRLQLQNAPGPEVKP